MALPGTKKLAWEASLRCLSVIYFSLLSFGFAEHVSSAGCPLVALYLAPYHVHPRPTFCCRYLPR